MSRKLEAKRWTAEYARRELGAWERSGLALCRFAASRGYQAQRLSWWKQRLQGEPAATLTPVALAPAVVTRAAGCAVAVGLSADGSVRVEVLDAETVHPQWLGQLVAALRRGE